MSAQLTLKGYLYPGDGGCSSCSRSSATAAAPFELAFRNCAERYAVVRSGDAQVQTSPAEFQPLPVADSFEAIELLALRTSGPVKVRLGGQPARVTTSSVFPLVALAGAELDFGVDGIPVGVVFETGDDTPVEVARRINAAAALVGVPFQPAYVASGQVVIEGQKTGSLGTLTDFHGAAAALLGLMVPDQVGEGAELAVDGLVLLQFQRTQGVQRIEVCGSASVSVLAAGT